MKEEMFWLCIDALDFKAHYNFYQVSSDREKYLGKEEAEFDKHVRNAHLDLYKSWTEWSSRSETSPKLFRESKLRSHVYISCLITYTILLGKKEYYKNLNNPRHFLDRIDDKAFHKFIKQFLTPWDIL